MVDGAVSKAKPLSWSPHEVIQYLCILNNLINLCFLSVIQYVTSNSTMPWNYHQMILLKGLAHATTILNLCTIKVCT